MKTKVQQFYFGFFHSALEDYIKNNVDVQT